MPSDEKDQEMGDVHIAVAVDGTGPASTPSPSNTPGLLGLFSQGYLGT